MRRSAVVGSLMAAALAACSSAPGPGVDGSEAEAACRAAARDVQTWCVGGLGMDRPEAHGDCLDARLRRDQACFPD